MIIDSGIHKLLRSYVLDWSGPSGLVDSLKVGTKPNNAADNNFNVGQER